MYVQFVIIFNPEKCHYTLYIVTLFTLYNVVASFGVRGRGIPRVYVSPGLRLSLVVELWI